MAPNPRRRREKAFGKHAQSSDPELAVYTRLVRRGWLKRTIQVTGDAEALIEYDGHAVGWGYDIAVVRVNGEEVAKSICESDSVLVAPTVSGHKLWFTLPTCHGPVSASASAEISSGGILARLVYLRLSIGGVLLYQEGGGRVLVRPQPTVPIPAAAPTPDVDTLPQPTDPPDPATGTLPRPSTGLSEKEPEAPTPWWRFRKR